MSNSVTKELIEEVSQKIDGGNYRNAAETVLERMKQIAEDNGDQETANQIGSILGKIFDIPNIDWGKSDVKGTYEITGFAR